MTYLQLKSALGEFTVFSLPEIRKVNPGFHRRRLTEWQEKGYLKKVIKGRYIFSDLALDEPRLFEIANRIYSPSYVSFEMALSYYGLVPETAYGVTSASTRRTYHFKTPIGEFKYRSIKKKAFFGYELVHSDNKCFKIASPEKAIADYFYLNNSLKQKKDFESLRMDRESFFEKIKEEKLFCLLEYFADKTFTKRIKSFVAFMKDA